MAAVSFLPTIVFPSEDGDTFAANAAIKSQSIAKQTGQWCIADDSGLVVPALNGRPGVHSARYGGKELDDAGRNQMLLQEMSTFKLNEERVAYFQAVISLAAPSGKEVLSVSGRLMGHILWQAQGTQGFGYDPIFQPEGFLCSLAELSMEEKNKISHRRQALRLFIEKTSNNKQGQSSHNKQGQSSRILIMNF